MARRRMERLCENCGEARLRLSVRRLLEEGRPWDRVEVGVVYVRVVLGDTHTHTRKYAIINLNNGIVAERMG